MGGMVSEADRETVEETLELLEEEGWNVSHFDVENVGAEHVTASGEIQTTGVGVSLRIERYD